VFSTSASLVNRSLVIGLAGACLLAVFHALQIAVGRYLHFDNPGKAALLGGVLAGLVFLAFQRIRRVAEALVDSQPFSAAGSNARRRSGASLPIPPAIRNDEALAGAMVAAADRFTNQCRRGPSTWPSGGV
jgi:hypothetical protein